MNAMMVLPQAARRAAIKVLPDEDRYKARFDIRSETSDRIYRISFDAAPGALYWKCSCPGYVRHGHCKHLEAMNLPGRSHGPSREWAAKLIGVR